MDFTGSDKPLTREELAWELAELFEQLSDEHVNELLAKNVPLETLRFIAAYAEDFSDVHELDDRSRRRIPNLVVLGYLMRVTEERLADDLTS